MRTPLAITQTNLDIIKGTPPDDTIELNKKWLDNIQEETYRMTGLINSLLFLARADNEKQLMEQEFFSLALTIQDAVNPMQLLAKTKNIALETHNT